MKLLSIFLIVSVNLSLSLAEPETKPARQGLIRDGVNIEGIDGRLEFDREKKHFFFILDDKFSDGSRFVRAGSEIELLKNNSLEAAIDSQRQEKGSINIRIWGSFTEHKGINYIFLSRYLPLKEIAAEENSKSGDQTENTGRQQESLIPSDILKQMEPGKVVDVKKVKDMLDAGSDVAITDRTAVVEKRGSAYWLRLDSYGQNVSDVSFILLGSEAAELLTDSLSDAPNRKRFNVAGVATEFEGANYFLLQRFRRAYPYGNFPR
jgi:hypothetical protein